MADTILNACNFDLGLIKYSSKKVNDRGGASISMLNSKTMTSIRLNLPMMMTWGVSDYVDPKTNASDGKYSMSLQFPNEEYTNPECEAVLENMIALEQKIKEDALAKSKDWFGKEHKNIEVIEALYSPMLKYPKIKGTEERDYSKKPTLRIKLPYWEGQFKCELYDEDGNIIYPKPGSTDTPLDRLTKLTHLMAIIQCGGIWYANGKFGITWKLLQAVVKKPRDTISGQCMIQLNSGDKAKFAEVESRQTEAETAGTEIVSDSDGEDEPAPEPEPEPEQDEPAPVQEPEPEPEVVQEKPKRVLRKKTSA